MRYFIFLFMLGLLYSCSSSNTIRVDIPESSLEENIPEWVKNHPASPNYYIGIGIANKNNQDINHREQAKKNALNDLASEISVNIKSNSFLFSMESDYDYNEDFKSIIKTEINKDLEGYELVDSWEDELYYKVYYRLSKSKYHQKQKEDKEKALTLCYDLFLKANSAEKKSDVLLAINLNIQALLSIKKYWNEINEYIVDDLIVIYLDKEIFTSIQRILSKIKLKANIEQFIVSYSNDFSNTLNVKSFYNNKNIPSIPIKLSYLKKSNYTQNSQNHSEFKSSNEYGVTSFLVSNIFMNNYQELEVELDVTKMLNINDENLNLIKELINNFPSSKLLIPVKIILPKIYIEPNEKKLGLKYSSNFLANTFRENFTKKNYDVVNIKPKDGFTLIISSDTKAEQNDSKFVLAYLNGLIDLRSNKTGKVLYNRVLSNIKGIHSSKEKASLKAYQEASKLINENIFNDLIKIIEN